MADLLSTRDLTDKEIYLCQRYGVEQIFVANIQPDQIYRAVEIARIFNVSYYTVRRRLVSGELPSSGTFNPSVSGRGLLEYLWSRVRSGRKF